MITYIESKSDKALKICTPQKFDDLTHSLRTAMLIDAYRSGQNPDAKSQLPAFIFMGYPPADMIGKEGSRKKSLLLPTGLVMMDYDHLKEDYGTTAREVHDKFLKLMPSLGLTLEHDLAFASITPSNNGYRLVLRLPRGKKIAEYQKFISGKLGMECDKAVKDISRISFVPKASDILYMNKALLFSPIESYAKAHEESVGSQSTIPTLACEVTDGNVAPQQADVQEECTQAEGIVTTHEEPYGSGATTSPSVTPYGATAEYGEVTGLSQNPCAASMTPSFPETYHGVPYTHIVEKWIELRGGTPEPGDRHATLVELAMDLRKICDNDKDWIASLMPDFDKGEAEKLDCIEWAVNRQYSKVSGTLQDALEALGIQQKEIKENKEISSVSSSEIQNAEGLPPKMPEKLPNLVKLLTSKVLPHQRPAVSAMIFPALATHVNNALFKLSDNTDVELSMMCCLLAKQSIGKGCVKQPLHAIMADIKATDDINRQREMAWQEQQKNKKANEKGQSKPDDLVIRWLNSDTTPAAFLGRLLAAQHGNADGSDLCTYTQVDEIEDLYNFCTSGGRNRICQMIKRTWDRDMIGAERFTANAANISTILRWNWAASSTIEGGKKFFKTSLTDGTTSRVDFCTIIPPGKVIQFRYGTYDNAFRTELKPYIDNLNSFRCEKDDYGFLIPCEIPEVLALEEEMNSYINLHASTEADDTWENYAWRAKVMAVKKLIVLYLANGCKWEDTFEDFAWWSFKYSMWCKINLFYDAASAQFHEERIAGTKGNRSPLKAMKRQFTYPEFVAVCQELGFKNPRDIMYKYKQRGVVIERDKQYIVDPEYAEKFGIK